MPTRTQAIRLTLYSLGHFLVDLTCAFVLISLVKDAPDERLLSLLLYNFCAFALQMPMGLIADRLNRNAAVAVLGLGTTLLAFACYPVPLLCSTVLGLGNGLYHVGGGVDVLHFSDKKQWMLGVFVSPGAIGLFIGGLLAKSKAISLSIGFAIILLISVLVTLGLNRVQPLKSPSGNVTPHIKACGSLPLVAGFMLFSVVVLRSYVGMTLTFPWKAGTWAMLAVLGTACGKAAGGFLADKFGALQSAAATLGVSAILFFFSQNPICGILAVFFFNMTMPLTLFAMAQLFPGARGFAFGTLTFALFLGYLPTQFSLPVPFAGNGLWYAAEAVISLILLCIGLRCARKKESDDGV